VDSGCRRLTASWVRERAATDADIELCDYYEAHEKAGSEALLPPGGDTPAAPPAGMVPAVLLP
jgi:DNA excision repair protein ERCC-2